MINKKYSSQEFSDADHIYNYEKLSAIEKEGMIQNPGIVDEEVWKRAKEAVKKEYGEYKWPIVMAVYEKMGGKTHRKGK